MKTNTYSKRSQRLTKDHWLRPKVFLQTITGVVVGCLLVGLVGVMTVTQLLSTSQDIRNQASTTGKDCNELCSSSAECSVNLRCYSLGSESRCRLAINPSNEQCYATPDEGLNRTCNQYCADTQECTAGLTCWYNQCRQPDNIDNPTCQVPTSTILATIQQNCNQSCDNNEACAVNMRCYNGQCRLAANPTSSQCVGSTVSVSDGTGQTKGGLETTNPLPTNSFPPIANLSPTVTVMPDLSLSPTGDPNLTTPPDLEEPSLPSDLPSETTNDSNLDGTISSDSGEVETVSPDQLSFFAQISAWWSDLQSPEQSNTRRMLLVVLSVGVILIGLALIISALQARSKSPQDESTDLDINEVTDSESTNQPQPSEPTIPPQTLTVASATNSDKSTGSATHQPADSPLTPVPKHISSAQLYPSGGMTMRLQKKGVTPPK